MNGSIEARAALAGTSNTTLAAISAAIGVITTLGNSSSTNTPISAVHGTAALTTATTATINGHIQTVLSANGIGSATIAAITASVGAATWSGQATDVLVGGLGVSGFVMSGTASATISGQVHVPASLAGTSTATFIPRIRVDAVWSAVSDATGSAISASVASASLAATSTVAVVGIVPAILSVYGTSSVSLPDLHSIRAFGTSVATWSGVTFIVSEPSKRRTVSVPIVSRETAVPVTTRTGRVPVVSRKTAVPVTTRTILVSRQN